MLDYNRVWTVMNELEHIVSKFTTIKDVADAIYDAAERKDYNKIESLANLVSNYTQYVMDDYDVAYATAWSEIVSKLHEQQHSKPVVCDAKDKSEQCQKEWNSFWDQLETK